MEKHLAIATGAAACLLLLMPVAAMAQTSKIRTGMRVDVLLKSGAIVGGTVESYTTDTLTIATGAGAKTVSLTADVREVSRTRNRAGAWALRGGLGGALVGAVLSVTGGGGDVAAGMSMLSGGGLFWGGIIGAFVNRKEVLYANSTAPGSLTLVPSVGPSRVGLRLAWRW